MLLKLKNFNIKKSFPSPNTPCTFSARVRNRDHPTQNGGIQNYTGVPRQRNCWDTARPVFQNFQGTVLPDMTPLPLIPWVLLCISFRFPKQLEGQWTPFLACRLWHFMVCLAHLPPATCSELRKFSEQGLERVETRENAGRRAKG